MSENPNSKIILCFQACRNTFEMGKCSGEREKSQLTRWERVIEDGTH
jgi:hypothetical protein